jgi:cobalt-zinc-cadmium efflux system outer membrane protein
MPPQCRWLFGSAAVAAAVAAASIGQAADKTPREAGAERAPPHAAVANPSRGAERAASFERLHVDSEGDAPLPPNVDKAKQPGADHGAKRGKEHRGDDGTHGEHAEPRAQAPVDAPPLSLGELEGIALDRNPTLAAAAAKIDAARGAYRQAGLPPNPRIGYEGSEIGNEGRQGMQGGFVAQEIVTGGKLRLSQAVACQAVLRAQQDYEAQRLRVLTDVRSEFYRVLAAQRRRELAEEVTGLSQKSVDTVKSLLDAGTASGIELLQGKIEVETAGLALETARNRHTAAWRRLASLLGSPEMTPARLDGDLTADLPTFEWDEIVARVVTQSPEIAAARIEVQRNALALRRAQQQVVPNIDVMLGAQKDFASGDTVANVQIEIPVPIWNRNQGNIYQARAELMAAEAEVSRVELSLRSRLAAAFERYMNARHHVDRYGDRIMPDAKEALTLTSRAYQNGQVGFLNVLAAQRTYFQASIAHLDAVAELRDTAALLDGLLLSDSLQTGAANADGARANEGMSNSSGGGMANIGEMPAR